MKYTKEILAAAVRDANTMADVMRNLGERPTGGLHAHLKRRIDHFKINTSHFTGEAHGKGGGLGARKLPPDTVLVMYPEGSPRRSPERLRDALSALGVPYACSSCGISRWRTEPLTLHVDHIDGNYLDCRRWNLRFICPNCHALTANYRGRSKRRGAVIVLEDGTVRRLYRKVTLTADWHRLHESETGPAPESLTPKQRKERDELVEAVRNSHSIAGVMRYLGTPFPSGGRCMTIKKRIAIYQIDTSHFTGHAHNKGEVSPRRKPPHEVLVERPPGAPRIAGERLRRALITSGVDYVCTGCANPGLWCGVPITLHVDHINGHHWDSRQCNLRFLCPNCHSQTSTFGKRSTRPDKRRDEVIGYLRYRGVVAQRERPTV